VKLILFADLHLDAPFAWLGGSQLAARRRRQALRQTLRNITRLATEVRADALLCAGDLFEQARYTPDTVSFLEQTFEEIEPLPVFLAPGNHDWYSAESPYRQARWSPNVHVFTEDRLTPVPLEDGLTLWGAAHRAPARTLGFLDNFRVDRDGVHLGLVHASERGRFTVDEPGAQPHAPFDAEQIAAAGLDHLLVGHYHRPQDADRYTYPGNPDFLNFGEDGMRGAVELTVLPDGRVLRVRHRVGVTDAHDLALSVTGCASQQEVRDRLAERLAGLTGVARVTVTGDLDPRVDLHARDLQDLPHGLDGVLVRLGRLRPAYDLGGISDEPTVRGQFVRDVLAAPLTDEDRQRVLLVGLRALEGRADLDPLG
jgi:DNA repair exonuclease SbcCD nuclease subunit